MVRLYQYTRAQRYIVRHTDIEPNQAFNISPYTIPPKINFNKYIFILYFVIVFLPPLLLEIYYKKVFLKK
jgi:hypothetical protein